MKLYLPPHTILSSVYRSPEDQLAEIVKRAKAVGFRFSRAPSVDDPSTWTAAYNLVNNHRNPIAKPGSSRHQRGVAFDLAPDLHGPSRQAIMDGLGKAAKAGAIHLMPPARAGWTNPRMEGRCVHVEIDAGTLDFEPFEVA
jgi:hypothetical protein